LNPFFLPLLHHYTMTSIYAAFIDSDSEGEIEETHEQKQMALARAALQSAYERFNAEWQSGKWGDWCWDEEDDERYRLGQIKAEMNAVQRTTVAVGCGCGKCSFLPHSSPPSHFSQEDAPFCCSKCRLSNGSEHGGHCQKIENL
jgi:hypothetical protein